MNVVDAGLISGNVAVLERFAGQPGGCENDGVPDALILRDLPVVTAARAISPCAWISFDPGHAAADFFQAIRANSSAVAERALRALVLAGPEEDRLLLVARKIQPAAWRDPEPGAQRGVRDIQQAAALETARRMLAAIGDRRPNG